MIESLDTELPEEASISQGIVEVFNRSGQQSHRLAWNGSKLKIGRAYDNDVVVSDPYVCPHHLEISTVDNRPRIRDLGSVNGSYVGSSKSRLDSTDLQDGVCISFGHSQLRFHSGNLQLAPTLRDNARLGFLSLLGRPWLGAIALLLGLLSLLGSEMLDDAGRLGPLGFAEEITYPLIGLLLWAGFWSLLNRIVAHRACFVAHVTITMLGVTLLFVCSQLIASFAFALDLGNAAWWLRWSGRTVVLAAVVYTHLRYFSQSPARRSVVVACLIALVLFGTPAVGSYIEKTQFSSLPWLDPILRPPAYQLRDGESINLFMERAADLKALADEEARD